MIRGEKKTRKTRRCDFYLPLLSFLSSSCSLLLHMLFSSLPLSLLIIDKRSLKWNFFCKRQEEERRFSLFCSLLIFLSSSFASFPSKSFIFSGETVSLLLSSRQDRLYKKTKRVKRVWTGEQVTKRVTQKKSKNSFVFFFLRRKNRSQEKKGLES